MKIVFRLVLACSFLVIGTTSFAQDANAIVHAHAEAVGGRKAMKAVKTIRRTATISLSDQGPSIPGVFMQKRPNKTRQEFVFQGQTIVQGFDGTNAWVINPLSGSTDAQKIPEPRATEVKRLAFIDDILWENIETRGIKLAYKGKEDIEGQPHHYVLVTYADGFQQHRYYNAATRFLHKVRQVQMDPTGQQVETVTTFEDYRPVEGLNYPHKIINSVGQTVVFEETELNVRLEDSQFNMPAKGSAP